MPILIPIPPVNGVGFLWNFLSLSGLSIRSLFFLETCRKIALDTKEAKKLKKNKAAGIIFSMSKINYKFFLHLFIIITFSSKTFSDSSLILNNLKIEKGFEIEIFAENIDTPRQIAESDAGNIFVGSRNSGTISVIDSDGNIRIIVDNLSRELLELGVRHADAGEFTRTALLNNKIDLIQAESLLSLINAKTIAGVQISNTNLAGSLTKRFKNMRELLIKTLGLLEGAFALAIIFKKFNLLVGSKKGSPLAIGLTDTSFYLGSDSLALSPFTQKIVYMEEGDSVFISEKKTKIQKRRIYQIAVELKTLIDTK